MAAHAEAGGAECSVGGLKKPARATRPRVQMDLAQGPLPHRDPESHLRLEERGLSLPHQNVGVGPQFLALLHQALRRLPDRLRSESYFGGKYRAAVEVHPD